MTDTNTVTQEAPAGAPPENQEPHLGPTRDATVSAIPNEIEFDIGSDKEPVEEKQPEKKPQHRPRNDPQRRIDQLTGKLRESETVQERILRENEELTRKFGDSAKTQQELTERAERAERAALVHHKRAATLEKAAAERDLQAAIEAADSAKQSEAVSRLSEASGKLAEIANWEAAHPQKTPEQPRQEQRPEPTEQPREKREQRATVDTLNPESRAWVERTAWFNPKSQDFDKEMHLTAVEYAKVLEQRLLRQGRQDEIETPDYFAKIEAHVRSEFPDYEWSEPAAQADTVIPARVATTQVPSRNQQRMPQMSRDNAVIPANGQATPGAQPRTGFKVELSDDEKEMAIGQYQNGAMGNYWRTGKPVASAREAVDQWAFRKLPADAQNKALQGVRR